MEHFLPREDALRAPVHSLAYGRILHLIYLTSLLGMALGAAPHIRSSTSFPFLDKRRSTAEGIQRYIVYMQCRGEEKTIKEWV